MLRIHEWSLFPSLIFPHMYLVETCPAGVSLKLCVCVCDVCMCMPRVSECAAASLIKNGKLFIKQSLEIIFIYNLGFSWVNL